MKNIGPKVDSFSFIRLLAIQNPRKIYLVIKTENPLLKTLNLLSKQFIVFSW